MNRLVPWQRLGTRGVTAVEFALVFPVFLMLVFGVIETGRLMWQQISMQRGVAIAARCGALRTTGCVSDNEIMAKAVSASALSGLVTANVATPDRTASCGLKVTASRQFTFILRVRDIPPITLSAQACHPFLQ